MQITPSEVQKQIFSTAMLINLSEMFPGVSSDAATANTSQLINDILSSAEISSFIGNWNAVWGPYVVVSDILNTENQPLNSLYIACNKDITPGFNTYLVGIAGTDGPSLDTWIFEDFDVAFTNALPNTPDAPNGAPATSRIANGTGNALNDLLSMGVDQPGGSALAYLKNNVMPGDVIYVCGHSLGGTLTPVISTYVYAQLPNNKIYSMPIASSATANPDFVNYYNSIFQAGPNPGNESIPFWNENDVAPNCFDDSTLVNLVNIFGPDISITALEFVCIEALTLAGGLNGYTQIAPYCQFPHANYPLSDQPPGSTNTWVDQAKCQHVAPYGEALSWPDYLCLVTSLANALVASTIISGTTLKYTFFTAGCGPQCGI